MGADCRILVSKKSLKNMSLRHAVYLINEFEGWWYRFQERFSLSDACNNILLSNLIKHMATKEKISQNDRDIIARFSEYDIIFCSESFFDQNVYIDLSNFVYNAFEEKKVSIKPEPKQPVSHKDDKMAGSLLGAIRLDFVGHACEAGANS